MLVFNYKEMAVDLKCPVAICGMELSSTSDIFCHLKSHIRSGLYVKCPYLHCSKRYGVVSSFSSHVSRYHTVSDQANVIQPTNHNSAYQPNSILAYFKDNYINEIPVYLCSHFK